MKNGLLVAAIKYLQVVFYRTHDSFLYLSHALKLCIEPFLKSFLISLLPFSPSWWMKDSHGFPSRSVNIHVVLSFRPKPSLPLLLLTGHLSPLERTIDVLQSQAVCHHFFIVDRRILIVLHSKIVHIWETVVLLSSGTGAALQVIHRISLNILRYFTCIKIYTFWSRMQKTRSCHTYSSIWQSDIIYGEFMMWWQHDFGKACQDLIPDAFPENNLFSILYDSQREDMGFLAKNNKINWIFFSSK